MSIADREWSIDIGGAPYIERQTGSRQFRVTFDIEVRPSDTLATARIRLYNASQLTAPKQGATIVFNAGYSGNVGEIFSGYITNTYQEREHTDIVTIMDCRSGDVTHRGSAEGSYGKGATLIDVLTDLTRQWPARLMIEPEQFKDVPVFTSGYVTSGDIPRALDSLGRQFGFEWSINKGSIYVNKRGADRPRAPVVEVNQFTGMVAMPEVTRGPEGLGVTVSLRLNPWINIGDRINIAARFVSFNTGNTFIQEMGGDATGNGLFDVFQMVYSGDSHGNEWTVKIDALRAGSAPAVTTGNALAWGARVSQDFRNKVRTIAGKLNCNPSWLMAVMEYETGGTFSPSVKNPVSTATGLIQFLERTAKDLGTTTRELRRMSAVEQLDYVEKYYRKIGKPIKTLNDAYLAVFYPVAMGKPDSHVLFRSGSAEYNANASLDTMRKGYITVADACVRANKSLKNGMNFTA